MKMFYIREKINYILEKFDEFNNDDQKTHLKILDMDDMDMEVKIKIVDQKSWSGQIAIRQNSTGSVKVTSFQTESKAEETTSRTLRGRTGRC